METKMTSVWYVEYTSLRSNDHHRPDVAVEETQAAAETKAEELRALHWISCITVTGPHQHRIPA